MLRTFALAALGGSLALAGPAAAQVWGRTAQGVPSGHRPPAGLCRVWYDRLPPGRQPAPTDCATAERVARRDGARVIYGPRHDYGSRDDKGRWKDKDDGKWKDGRYDRDGRYGRDDDDRYRRARRDHDGAWCRDANRDGRCDDRRRGRTVARETDQRVGDWCADRDRNGRCDGTIYRGDSRRTDGRSDGRTLPEVLSGVIRP